MLKLENSLWVEKVRWALAAPLVFATGLELLVNVGSALDRVGLGVTVVVLVMDYF